MRANFARHGRRLFVHRLSAPSCASYAAPARRGSAVASRPYRQFERTFFGVLFQKPPRELRQTEYEPGWLQIMIWGSRVQDNLRPPPRKEVLDSWRKLMQSKLKTRIPLNSNQAAHCNMLLHYFFAEPSSPSSSSSDSKSKLLSATDLSIIRQVILELEPYVRTSHHLDLARSVHAVWVQGTSSGKARPEELQWSYLVKVLALYGRSREAMEMLQLRWDSPSYCAHYVQGEQLLEAVARGLARDGLDQELVELVKDAENHGMPYNAALQRVLVTHFARQNKIPETKLWFTKKIEQKHSHVQTYRELASFAMRNNLQDWATKFFVQLGDSQPKKKYWDSLLQAILLMGKSLTEVETMMSHMLERNKELSADINTINGLLTVAVETHNFQLSEDLIKLARENGLSMNGETYLRLLQVSLHTENLLNAEALFQQAKYFELESNESNSDLFKEYQTFINTYLTTLCHQQPPDFKLIATLLEYVDEQQLRLEPETVAILCRKFLENEQHFDVMDILSLQSFMYGDEERELLQSAFVTYCLDPDTSTSRAWNAYQILYQLFQDTSYDRRMQLLEGFIERKRLDMAALVFRHMRTHRSKDFHPTITTYIRIFEGLAEHPDRESLADVHNMLKTDTTIQPNTKLYTALMLAYGADGRPLTALDFWKHITQSREGPSYASLESIFWVLERKSHGSRQATEIWEKIEQMDLEVPPSVYNAYVGAMAGTGLEKEVRDIIVKMPASINQEPSALTLGIAYNALPGQKLQASFQQWAEKRYRDLWAEMMKAGRRVDEYGMCKFKIKRVPKS